MNEENIYDEIGEIGLYQVIMFILIGSITAIPSLIGYSYVFAGATPEFRCKIPDHDHDAYDVKDAEHANLIKNYIPESSNLNDPYEKCLVKIYLESELKSLNGSLNYTLEKCTSWVYSNKHYSKTLVTEWNLVCHQAHFKSIYLTLHFLGTMGVLIIGILSDKIGRRKIAYILIRLSFLFSLLTTLLLNVKMFTLETNKILYGLLKFLSGLSSNVYAVALILTIELTGPKKRIIASNIVAFAIVISNLILGLVSYFIRNYEILSIFVTCAISFFVVSFYFVPESPIWLISKNKKQAALKIFEKIAKSNGKNCNEVISSLETFDCVKSPTCLESKKFKSLHVLKLLLKSRLHLLRTVVLLVNWFFLNITFYGISYYTGNLDGNPYLNFMLSSFVELVAIVLIQLTIERFGRKIPFSTALFLASVLFFVIFFIPKEYSQIATALALMAKCAIAFNFNSIYTITSEYYPTQIRNTILAFCICIGKLGSVLMPFIYLYAELYYEHLPYIFFGVTNILCFLSFSFIFPNTRQKKLAQSLDEFFKT